jgi:hypothetical protein
VNQNSRFDPWARKLFFVPAPKIVLQQYRPIATDDALTANRRFRGIADMDRFSSRNDV